MSQPPPNSRNRVRRLPKRAAYDRQVIYGILDEALICHVGIVEEGQPVVIPINFARLGNEIVLHGSLESRLLRHIAAGNPVCIEASLVDGLVLARSVFHQSVNYRSVVMFGRGRVLEGREEKLAALRAVTEHLIPGRWEEARHPDEKELNATLVVAVPIEEASAKLRSGPPVDDEADTCLPVWAGVLPLEVLPGTPQPEARLPADCLVPGYIAKYTRKITR
jgi:nitroimidazol reductase NimA-like FMN-containing flavoprotein (pyridoxamine 5'-phosphate oxidase superfamily)